MKAGITVAAMFIVQVGAVMLFSQWIKTPKGKDYDAQSRNTKDTRRAV